MIDPASQAVLQEVVRRESRSLLSYIGDAYPWATTEQSPRLAILRKLVREEGSAVSALGQYLVRQKSPPLLGSYPATFTSCNFIALDYLLPRLLEAQQRSITELQADLSKIQHGPSRLEAERLLAVKKRTLAGLERLDEAPAPVGT